MIYSAQILCWNLIPDHKPRDNIRSGIPVLHQSCIHLSLHYTDLSDSAREEIWKGFLAKAGDTPFETEDIVADEIRELSRTDLNGRQIKNVVKVAVSLANDEKRPLSLAHLRGAMKVVVGNVAQIMILG